MARPRSGKKKKRVGTTRLNVFDRCITGTGNISNGHIPLYGNGANSSPTTTIATKAKVNGTTKNATAKPSKKKTTIADFNVKYRDSDPISIVTAYDYPSAKLVSEAGLDAILVGDSVGMVVMGYDDTTSVTMSDMLHHCKCVARGASDGPFLIGDLPFGSYLTPTAAVENACALIKEGRMDAVKLEGGARVATHVHAICNAGIAVMGHIGLTPQTAASMGGYRVQGRTADAAYALIEDAQALEEAGCFAVVLEVVPDIVARRVADAVDIPIIGIGAGIDGPAGQVQVLHDVLGLYDRLQPKFSRQFVDCSTFMRNALIEYRKGVQERSFPIPGKESFAAMAKGERAIFENKNDNKLKTTLREKKRIVNGINGNKINAAASR